MADVSVKGIYRDGVVELSEKVAASNGQNVIVIFPQRLPPQDAKSYREQLEASIARSDPEFRRRLRAVCHTGHQKNL